MLNGTGKDLKIQKKGSILRILCTNLSPTQLGPFKYKTVQNIVLQISIRPRAMHWHTSLASQRPLEFYRKKSDDFESFILSI